MDDFKLFLGARVLVTRQMKPGRFQILLDRLLFRVVEFALGQAPLGQVEGAGSRSEVDRRKLGVAVIRKVARSAIQFEPADVRRVDGLVATLDEFVLDERLQKAANGRSSGIHRIRPLPTRGLMVNSLSCLPSRR